MSGVGLHTKVCLRRSEHISCVPPPVSSEVYLGGKLPYPPSDLTYQSLIMAKDRQHKPYRCPSTWIHHPPAERLLSQSPSTGFSHTGQWFSTFSITLASSFSIFYYFTCLSVLLVCTMSLIWCPRRSEEDMESPGIGIEDSCELPCG